MKVRDLISPSNLTVKQLKKWEQPSTIKKQPKETRGTQEGIELAEKHICQHAD